MTLENLATKNNKVFLCGTVQSEPVFSHELYGEGFYEFTLKVLRLSEQSDVVPVTVSERLLNEHKIEVGNKVALNGQFRSYNKMFGTRSKLMLTVFVRDFCPVNDDNPNQVDLIGFVCKTPVYRTTPFNREICDLLLAVNRAYNKSDYIPCIAWGRNARYVKNLEIGKKISVSGRIQSREYSKRINDETNETRIAYELSINKIADASAEDGDNFDEE